MRFKIEYLGADQRICNWVFPKALDTLDDAIAWTRQAAWPQDAASIIIRDAADAGAIVWQDAATSSDVIMDALSPIEA